MTIDAIKLALADELFTKGRIWSAPTPAPTNPELPSSVPETTKTEVKLVKLAVSHAMKDMPYGDTISVVVDEVIDKALSDDPQGFPTDGSIGAALPTLTSRMGREFGAVSVDLLEAGGVKGIPSDLVQEVTNGLMSGRYSDMTSEDWKLWINKDLRQKLVGQFVAEYDNGAAIADIVEGLLGTLEEPAEEVPPVAVEAPSLPTALSLKAKATSVSSTIGSFGTVGFEVSPREIFTLNDLSRKRTARFAEHKVINGKARLQFNGVDLWSTTIKINLDRNWTDPEKRIEQLTQIQESGEHYPLVVGGRNFGQFVLLDYSEDIKTFGRFGEIEKAELSLSFKEYSDEGSGIVRISRIRTAAPAPVKTTAPAKKMAISNNYGGR